MSPLGFDPAALPGAIANRVLGREAWARTQLAAHAGRVFVVAIGPVAAAMRVDSAGMVESTALCGRAPDLHLTLSPLSAPTFLADPTRWDDLVAAEGDPALAATLKELARTLPWFVEQAFAQALGPIVGQRLADAGRRLLAFPEYAATRVGESVASYARDEAGLLARAEDLRHFAQDVAGLATRTDALGARLDALAACVGPGIPD
jgi:ubiquinone biosynthesis protein UbiJ